MNPLRPSILALGVSLASIAIAGNATAATSSSITCTRMGGQVACNGLVTNTPIKLRPRVFKIAAAAHGTVHAGHDLWQVTARFSRSTWRRGAFLRGTMTLRVNCAHGSAFHPNDPPFAQTLETSGTRMLTSTLQITPPLGAGPCSWVSTATVYTRYGRTLRGHRLVGGVAWSTLVA